MVRNVQGRPPDHYLGVRGSVIWGCLGSPPGLFLDLCPGSLLAKVNTRLLLENLDVAERARKQHWVIYICHKGRIGRAQGNNRPGTRE